MTKLCTILSSVRNILMIMIPISLITARAMMLLLFTMCQAQAQHWLWLHGVSDKDTTFCLFGHYILMIAKNAALPLAPAKIVQKSQA